MPERTLEEKKDRRSRVGKLGTYRDWGLSSVWLLINIYHNKGKKCVSTSLRDALSKPNWLNIVA